MRASQRLGTDSRRGLSWGLARGLAWMAAPLLAAVTLACGSEGESPRVVVDGGGEVTFGPSPTEATSTPASEPTAAATSEPTPTPTPPAEATADPEATPRWGTVTATPGGLQEGSDNPAGAAGDLAGVPHSTADVRAAVEAAGYVFFPVGDEVRALCPNTSVPELVVWTAGAGGTDFGPVFSLWVYPSAEAMRADWSTSTGRVQPLTAGCDPPTGHVYWNGNAILAFNTWLDGGEDIGPGGHAGSPREYRTVEAFLGMPR